MDESAAELRSIWNEYNATKLKFRIKPDSSKKIFDVYYPRLMEFLPVTLEVA
jgi:hypothetical protein